MSEHSGGHTISSRGTVTIDVEHCKGCELCIPACPPKVLTMSAWTNRTGVEYQREGFGLLARAFQHEMDHLDGTLFVDRLRGIKRDMILRKIRKLSRAGKW